MNQTKCDATSQYLQDDPETEDNKIIDQILFEILSRVTFRQIISKVKT